MKKSLILLSASLPLVAVGAGQPSLLFPDQKVELPPLSLAERPKPNPLGVLPEAAAFFQGTNPPAVLPGKKFISKMPILSPGEPGDAKMIKTPDASIDYKLIVKAPDVESKQ